ncbi:membrane protein UL45-like protein [Phocid alphaherpesvirus 1]|uniref:Membrane protein UL45-like protein n=1 Tax=Phocid alphaherpesvirus 1 TaxID=47418 RepID=A0A482F3S5_9ALPH|nr:membrane protein UL45-like protein [Phocid alphaherpesvirus 1]QBN85164.1 membrane protein UL45-like protein [Phocid alphaherpesvirus 1]UNP64234.1 membrane protein UL45-like protein [Phocid alphaherpesvirus 1]
MAQLVLTDIPLDDTEIQNVSNSEEFKTVNVNQRNSTCQCLCISVGFFVAGILITIAALIVTFIFTIPLDMLGATECPPSTLGVNNVCVKLVQTSVKSYTDLSKICSDKLTSPANQTTINSLFNILNIFADEKNKYYKNGFNSCVAPDHKNCNSSIAICQTDHPLSSLGDFIFNIRKIF